MKKRREKNGDRVVTKGWEVPVKLQGRGSNLPASVKITGRVVTSEWVGDGKS